MPRAAWALAVLLALAGPSGLALAQPAPVAPTGGPPRETESEPLGLPPPEPSATPVTSNRPNKPPPVLGAPVGPARAELPPTGPVTTASFPEPVPADAPRRAAALGAPTTTGNRVPARAVEPAARTVNTSSPPSDPVNDFLATRSALRDKDREAAERSSGFGGRIGDWFHGVFGNTAEWFKSDHMFDGFISPVTNPFLFEDPRSLTEVRPIFLFQKVPGAQPDFDGGNIWFFGTQARLAFTDRLSFVFHKLGGISVNPGSPSTFDGETGFAELWLGPKYTFIRNEDACRLVAGGLQFQIPAGSRNVFQDTGSLSIVPYASYAENFLRDLRIGSVNAMLGTGYSFSVDKLRSDYYYLSAHLDLDVGNAHRFYPLTELNWLIYTTNGHSRPIGSEGRDLINFGGQAKGKGLLTWAIGARYKISESAQLGAAFELPVAGPRDIFRYRFTVDFILRY
jgi:hypothetical protein